MIFFPMDGLIVSEHKNTLLFIDQCNAVGSACVLVGSCLATKVFIG